MTRQDWVCLGIRILGLYLLVQALGLIPHMAVFGVRAWQESHYQVPPDVEAPEHRATYESMAETRAKHALDVVRSSAVHLVLFTLIGLYLLTRGRFLFRLVSRPIDAASPHPPEASSEDSGP